MKEVGGMGAGKRERIGRDGKERERRGWGERKGKIKDLHTLEIMRQERMKRNRGTVTHREMGGGEVERNRRERREDKKARRIAREGERER